MNSKESSLWSLRNLRLLAVVVGAVGVIWGTIETLVALEVLDSESALSPLDGRTGWGIGLGMLAVWLCALAGTVLTLRFPAWGTTLLFIGGCGGFLLVGAPWIVPGILLSGASWLALLGIKNPFAAEMEAEAAATTAAQAEPRP
jgi:hypothetical protein